MKKKENILTNEVKGIVLKFNDLKENLDNNQEEENNAE